MLPTSQDNLHKKQARASKIEETSDQQGQKDSINPETKGFILALRLTFSLKDLSQGMWRKSIDTCCISS